MANSFGKDILIQAEDLQKAESFYVDTLGFKITGRSAGLISIEGDRLSLFIEHGPALGPILEIIVENVESAKNRLLEQGCVIIKDEPEFPRCYVRDPFGLIYNLRM